MEEYFSSDLFDVESANRKYFEAIKVFSAKVIVLKDLYVKRMKTQQCLKQKMVKKGCFRLFDAAGISMNSLQIQERAQIYVSNSLQSKLQLKIKIYECEQKLRRHNEGLRGVRKSGPLLFLMNYRQKGLFVLSVGCWLQQLNRMGANWTVLLITWGLLSAGVPLNWMAGGNFTQVDFAKLRVRVNALQTKPPETTYAASASTMSNDLNAIWAPAWNVVVVSYQNGSNYDSVIYGYAFRNHWYWQNGMQALSKDYFSVIVWKDFNCFYWMVLDPVDQGFKPSSFSDATYSGLTNSLRNMAAIINRNYVWTAAQTIQKIIASQFNDKLAFSIATSNAPSAAFHANICVKDYMVVPSSADNVPSNTGIALIMKMR